MKLSPVFLAVAFTALLGLVAASAAAKDEDSDHDSKAAGSIQVQGRHKRAELVTLARISFDDALKAAEARVPGSVIKAELEAEHHTLMYSFEIAAADKTVTEVEIDAGNGQVLDVDRD